MLLLHFELQKLYKERNKKIVVGKIENPNFKRGQKREVEGNGA
jgi:hypothetical protein